MAMPAAEATDLVQWVGLRRARGLVVPFIHPLKVFVFGFVTHRVTRFHTGDLIKCRDDTLTRKISHGLIRLINCREPGEYIAVASSPQ
jgi:hypothetical protein